MPLRQTALEVAHAQLVGFDSRRSHQVSELNREREKSAGVGPGFRRRSAKKMKLSKILAATSIGVFHVSLMLPGFHYAGADPASTMAGIELVAIGWVAVTAGIFAWLGNPLLLTAWVCFFLRKTALSVTFSALAMLAMLEFLIHLDRKLVFTSNAPPVTIAACGPAYYLWLASSVLMLGAAIAARLLPKEDPAQPPEPTR
jgi:hypothetical protein